MCDIFENLFDVIFERGDVFLGETFTHTHTIKIGLKNLKKPK